jgi:hypothetical protein
MCFGAFGLMSDLVWVPMTIDRLTDVTAVEAAVGEYDRIGRTAFLEKYGFGRAREFMLRMPSGALYDSKAIVGAAFGYQYPDQGPLSANAFSGGEATVERKLIDLGFDVIRIGDPWSRLEAELAVADYFQMLELEARGEGFNKSERNAELRQKLSRRSKSSVELKHQNISAILDELGLPFIRGYKPRGNVQELLREIVREQVDRQQTRFASIIDNLSAASLPSERSYVGVLVDPPRPEHVAGLSGTSRTPRKLDYAARDERNRTLGRAGEQWVMGYETTRLGEVGYPELASQVTWVSENLGDGAGYDIKSFTDAERDRYIEVKTTNGGPLTPFIVSANELIFSKEATSAFFLYRLFQYSSRPYIFILQGDLEETLSLAPTDYRARLRSLT